MVTGAKGKGVSSIPLTRPPTSSQSPSTDPPIVIDGVTGDEGTLEGCGDGVGPAAVHAAARRLRAIGAMRDMRVKPSDRERDLGYDLVASQPLRRVPHGPNGRQERLLAVLRSAHAVIRDGAICRRLCLDLGVRHRAGPERR